MKLLKVIFFVISLLASFSISFAEDSYPDENQNNHEANPLFSEEELQSNELEETQNQEEKDK